MVTSLRKKVQTQNSILAQKAAARTSAAASIAPSLSPGEYSSIQSNGASSDYASEVSSFMATLNAQLQDYNSRNLNQPAAEMTFTPPVAPAPQTGGRYVTLGNSWGPNWQGKRRYITYAQYPG